MLLELGKGRPLLWVFQKHALEKILSFAGQNRWNLDFLVLNVAV